MLSRSFQIFPGIQKLAPEFNVLSNSHCRRVVLSQRWPPGGDTVRITEFLMLVTFCGNSGEPMDLSRSHLGHSCVGASPDITRYHLAAIRKQVSYGFIWYHVFWTFWSLSDSSCRYGEFVWIHGHSRPFYSGSAHFGPGWMEASVERWRLARPQEFSKFSSLIMSHHVSSCLIMSHHVSSCLNV